MNEFSPILRVRILRFNNNNANIDFHSELPCLSLRMKWREVSRQVLLRVE